MHLACGASLERGAMKKDRDITVEAGVYKYYLLKIVLQLTQEQLFKDCLATLLLGLKLAQGVQNS